MKKRKANEKIEMTVTEQYYPILNVILLLIVEKKFHYRAIKQKGVVNRK